MIGRRRLLYKNRIEYNLTDADRILFASVFCCFCKRNNAQKKQEVLCKII